MKSIYFILALGISFVATAQNKIIGTVTDADQKPLANVIVSLPEIHKETVTNETGNFTLNTIPQGNFKISFSLVGFEGKILSVSKQTRCFLQVFFPTYIVNTSTRWEPVANRSCTIFTRQ